MRHGFRWSAIGLVVVMLGLSACGSEPPAVVETDPSVGNMAGCQAAEGFLVE